MPFRDEVDQTVAVMATAPLWDSEDRDGKGPLGVTVQRDQDALVVVAVGEVDMHTAPTLSAALDFALARTPPLLVVDLSDVTFLASAGLSLLVTAHQQAGEHTKVRVVATAHAILRPIQITALDTLLAIYSSRDRAVAG
jgi:anti-anti-sigma factor